MPDSGNIQLDTLQHKDHSQETTSHYGGGSQLPEQESLDTNIQDDSVEYPGLIRVILITMGVALCSFCVGLVSRIVVPGDLVHPLTAMVPY
jgi:hypothetical protein